MDHPIVLENSKTLRQRVIQLLSTGYNLPRTSNIVFVCGGNNADHMRTRFREFCKEHLNDFEIFLPEAAMENALSAEDPLPFNIADFETLVGSLAHAIVVFPEAPGSFAETGYFSAINALSQKCILVLDSNKQRSDSFISLGPAALISGSSRFHPNIQLNYNDPDFDAVAERIRRIDRGTYKKAFNFDKFSDLENFGVACLLHQVVNIFRVCTYEELHKFLTALFKNRYSKAKVHRVLSILVGAGYLRRIGDYGHFATNPDKPELLTIRDGSKNDENEIRLLILESLQTAGADLASILEAANYVD